MSTTHEVDGATLRRMRWWDIPRVLELEQALYPVDAWSEALFWEELAGVPETRHFVVLEREGVVIGYAGLMCPHRGADADVQTLTVSEEFQRRGYGQTLLSELIIEAQRRRAPFLLLEVREDNNAAIALYERDGFTTISTRRNYYAPGINALVMRKRLT
jgi:[ribosomal protein S18]-alanine N-acetyltransferase